MKFGKISAPWKKKLKIILLKFNVYTFLGNSSRCITRLLSNDAANKLIGGRVSNGASMYWKKKHEIKKLYTNYCYPYIFIAFVAHISSEHVLLNIACYLAGLNFRFYLIKYWQFFRKIVHIFLIDVGFVSFSYAIQFLQFNKQLKAPKNNTHRLHCEQSWKTDWFAHTIPVGYHYCNCWGQMRLPQSRCLLLDRCWKIIASRRLARKHTLKNTQNKHKNSIINSTNLSELAFCFSCHCTVTSYTWIMSQQPGE